MTRLFKTRNNVRSWLDWDIFIFFIRTPLPPAPIPLWKAVLCSFCRRHQYVAGVLKKDRGCLLLLIEEGGGKIDCPILFSAPPLFISRAGLQSFIQKDSARGLNPYYFYVLPCGQKRYSLVINFIAKNGTRFVEFQH